MKESSLSPSTSTKFYNNDFHHAHCYTDYVKSILRNDSQKAGVGQPSADRLRSQRSRSRSRRSPSPLHSPAVYSPQRIDRQIKLLNNLKQLHQIEQRHNLQQQQHRLRLLKELRYSQSAHPYLYSPGHDPVRPSHSPVTPNPKRSHLVEEYDGRNNYGINIKDYNNRSHNRLMQFVHNTTKLANQNAAEGGGGGVQIDGNVIVNANGNGNINGKNTNTNTNVSGKQNISEYDLRSQQQQYRNRHLNIKNNHIKQLNNLRNEKANQSATINPKSKNNLKRSSRNPSSHQIMGFGRQNSYKTDAGQRIRARAQTQTYDVAQQNEESEFESQEYSGNQSSQMSKSFEKTYKEMKNHISQSKRGNEDSAGFIHSPRHSKVSITNRSITNRSINKKSFNKSSNKASRSKSINKGQKRYIKRRDSCHDNSPSLTQSHNKYAKYSPYYQKKGGKMAQSRYQQQYGQDFSQQQYYHHRKPNQKPGRQHQLGYLNWDSSIKQGSSFLKSASKSRSRSNSKPGSRVKPATGSNVLSKQTSRKVPVPPQHQQSQHNQADSSPQIQSLSSIHQQQQHHQQSKRKHNPVHDPNSFQINNTSDMEVPTSRSQRPCRSRSPIQKKKTINGYYPTGIEMSPDGKFLVSKYKNVVSHSFGRPPKRDNPIDNKPKIMPYQQKSFSRGPQGASPIKKNKSTKKVQTSNSSIQSPNRKTRAMTQTNNAKQQQQQSDQQQRSRRMSSPERQQVNISSFSINSSIQHPNNPDPYFQTASSKQMYTKLHREMKQRANADSHEISSFHLHLQNEQSDRKLQQKIQDQKHASKIQKNSNRYDKYK